MYHRYFPMRQAPLASEADVKAMQEKLEARVKTLAAAQSPKEKAPLQWEKPVAGATGLKTKCKRYSCAKVTTDGKVSYELWKLAHGSSWFCLLNGGLDNFLQVQKLAQIDADKEGK